MLVLRSALFNLWFFGATFLLGLGGLAVRLFTPRRGLDYARFWAGTLLAGARVICGIHVEVIGAARLPTGPAVIASQHQSALDTLIWMRLVPRASYVYKAELARIPLFGPMLVAAGQIPLDRGASVGTLRKFLREVDRARLDGRQIIIFPEGTRVAFGDEVALRPGFVSVASRTGLPIIPVATDSGRVWGRKAFRKRPGCVHIHVGEPSAPDLPQEVVVSTLRQRWRDAQLAGSPVDISVD